MKTTIVVENDIAQQAAFISKQLGWSLEKLYSLAIQEFIQTHNPDPVTAQLDSIYATQSSKLDNSLMQAQYNAVGGEDWYWKKHRSSIFPKSSL
jgi:hypothetical protein